MKHCRYPRQKNRLPMFNPLIAKIGASIFVNGFHGLLLC
jgi:hypothetical protein